MKGLGGWYEPILENWMKESSKELCRHKEMLIYDIWMEK